MIEFIVRDNSLAQRFKKHVEKQAARIYDVAVVKLFGPFARFSFPDGISALQGGAA